MKKITHLFAIFALLFSSHAFALYGYVKDNRYHTPESIFSVDVPDLVSVTTQARTAPDAPSILEIVFSPSNHYWMRDALYELDIIPYQPTTDFNDSIYKLITPALKLLLANRAENLKIRQCKFLNNPKSTYFRSKYYQCTAEAIVDGTPANIVYTSRITKRFFLNNRHVPVWIVNSYAIEQKKPNGFNWTRYNNFINSINIDLKRVKQLNDEKYQSH